MPEVDMRPDVEKILNQARKAGAGENDVAVKRSQVVVIHDGPQAPRLPTVRGLMLVSLAKIALGTGDSSLAMMGDSPDLNVQQRRAVRIFALDRWMPALLSCMTSRSVHT